jgi:hypothetical protein
LLLFLRGPICCKLRLDACRAVAFSDVPRGTLP